MAGAAQPVASGASEAMNSAWKPIDLAPRDGRRIVIAYRSPISDDVSVFVSRWSEDGEWEGEGVLGELEPTAGLVPFAWTEMPA